jgi:hypothetical protein
VIGHTQGTKLTFRGELVLINLASGEGLAGTACMYECRRVFLVEYFECFLIMRIIAVHMYMMHDIMNDSSSKACPKPFHSSSKRNGPERFVLTESSVHKTAEWISS